MIERIPPAAVMLLVASVARADPDPNGHCLRPDVCDQGRFVVFDTMSTNLHDSDSSAYFDVYLVDRESSELRLVSSGLDGRSGDGPSSHATISGDGRLIAFVSDATNLTGGDSNGVSDIFVFDVEASGLRRLPIAGEGKEPDGDSRLPRISGDGRFVVFQSTASNLVPGDVNSASDVFVHEIATGKTELISVSSEGEIGFYGSGDADISRDGRYVAFISHADTLAPNDFNDQSDVFVRDRVSGTTSILSVTPEGVSGNGVCQSPRIAGDGSAVAFVSWSSNLTEGGSVPGPDVFRCDVGAGTIECLSRGASGEAGEGHSQNPAISDQGSRVVFLTLADNVAGQKIHGSAQVVSVDRDGARRLVTTVVAGPAENRDCADVSLDGSGEWVVFSTKSGPLLGIEPLSKAIVVVGRVETGELTPALGR